jgi:serine phosphatase RsbU (regulator of sigma subunit)/anti-sigma regulatory factor (Ser/Thr protein kinase)
VALIAAAVLSVGAVSERNTRRALSREIETRLVLQARNLALTGAGALLSEFPELTLVPLVKKMQAERPELAFVVVVDHRGMIQGHAEARQLGEPFRQPPGLAPIPSALPLQSGELLLANRDLLVVETQVSHPSEPNLGRAVVGVRRAYIEAAVSAARREQLAYLVLLLGVGATLGLVLLSRLLRPIGDLRAGLERIGRGDLDTPLAVRERTELGLLAEEVNDMAARLKAARSETVERERLAREVELAREIQQRLLPQGRRAAGEYALVGAHRAAAEVGGDYFDFLERPDGRIAVAIADVSGKGLGGCLVMSMLSALLRALYTTYESPTMLLVALEGHLLETLKPGEFVTMFYGLLDPRTGRLVYASAGHTPVLMWRSQPGTAEWLESEGIPLGAVRGALGGSLDDRTIELKRGDLLIQFTDGYNEAFDTAGQVQFGFERIERVVREHAPRGADAVVAALQEAVQTWNRGEPLDDETVLVVWREGAAAPQAESATTAAATPAAVETLEALDPLAALARAQAEGTSLTLPAHLESLGAIRGWIAHCPDLHELAPEDSARLETALYEACANVAEHGLQLDENQSFDLWWVPAGGNGRPSGIDERIRDGFFLLRDAGFPFSPGRWHPQDLGDPKRRLYGRGLGLDLIHIAMDHVVYRPATAAGNLTFLTFDPAKARHQRKEEPHV